MLFKVHKAKKKKKNDTQYVPSLQEERLRQLQGNRTVEEEEEEETESEIGVDDAEILFKGDEGWTVEEAREALEWIKYEGKIMTKVRRHSDYLELFLKIMFSRGIRR